MNRIAKRVAVSAAALTLAAVTTTVGTASASPQPNRSADEATGTNVPAAGADVSATDSCLIGNINNRQWWTAISDDRGAFAEFYEYGELFRVIDGTGHGMAVAYFSYCYNNGWTDSKVYVVGIGDERRIDYDFAEGRKVRFRACNYNGLAVTGCSPWKYGNA